MKKIFVTLFAAMFVLMAMLVTSGAATATSDNKKVEFCHATGSVSNPYEFIETSVNAFYNAGHIDHTGDIWAAFSYTNNGGQVVNVAAQGDTSLLAFEDCQKPAEDVLLDAPSGSFVDKCEVANDTVSVAAGQNYTVGSAVYDTAVSPNTGTISATANAGFKFKPGQGVSADGKTFTYSHTFTNSDDCDLPETGGNTTNVVGGTVVVVLILGILYFLTRRNRV